MLAGCEVQRKKVRTPLEKEFCIGLITVMAVEPHMVAGTYQVEKRRREVNQ